MPNWPKALSAHRTFGVCRVTGVLLIFRETQRRHSEPGVLASAFFIRFFCRCIAWRGFWRFIQPDHHGGFR